MRESPLILGLSAVFAGLTVLLLGAGAATSSVFVIFVAIPLGITAAIMWLHGTGRLDAHVRARAGDPVGSGRAAGRRGDPRRRAANRGRTAQRGRTAGSGPFTGGGRFDDRFGGFDGGGPFTGDGGRFGGRRRTAGGGRRTDGAVDPGMSTREAAAVLGVAPDADEATVKRAYREKVKRHHPDVEGGDEATFKRIAEAYERLT